MSSVPPSGKGREGKENFLCHVTPSFIRVTGPVGVLQPFESKPVGVLQNIVVSDITFDCYFDV
jgi:hypothetical protein